MRERDAEQKQVARKNTVEAVHEREWLKMQKSTAELNAQPEVYIPLNSTMSSQKCAKH